MTQTNTIMRSPLFTVIVTQAVTAGKVRVGVGVSVDVGVGVALGLNVRVEGVGVGAYQQRIRDEKARRRGH